MSIKSSLLLLVFFFLAQGSDLGWQNIQLGSDIHLKYGKTSGASLNFDGTVVAVTDPKYNNDVGKVKVYQWSDDGWTQKGEDMISGKAEGDTEYGSGSVEISSDGAVVAMGAARSNGLRGHVRVFRWINNVWTQLGQDFHGEAYGDQSGYKISLSKDGTVLAIAASNNDGNGYREDSGHARVYQWSNNEGWTQRGEDLDGEDWDDHSGRCSLNSAGDIIAIGATSNDGGAGYNSRSGHVRVYQWLAEYEVWTQLGQDIDGEGYEDFSGWSVSLNGDGTILAIGTPYNDDNGRSSGYVRIYQWDNEGWTQMGQNIAGNYEYARFGSRVELNERGDTVAVGTSESDYVGIYRWFNDEWTRLIPDIDLKGTSNHDFPPIVSLSGDGSVVAIGVENKMRVRVFQLQGSPSMSPSISPPSQSPSFSPSEFPTTPIPTYSPSISPTFFPTTSPTIYPSHFPTTTAPTKYPTTSQPTTYPSKSPSTSPTAYPTTSGPTVSPSVAPSFGPTTSLPTFSPSSRPTARPTTSDPSISPSQFPSSSNPSISPSQFPSTSPSQVPSISPFRFPSKEPTMGNPVEANSAPSFTFTTVFLLMVSLATY